MDEKYYRPSKDQLVKIVPKIESETTTNIDSDGYVSAYLTDLRVVALEKRIAELEKQIKSMIQPGG